MASTVSLERRGVATIVTIERPERRNAVDADTADQLYQAFQAFDADEEALVGILQGRGGHFCGGADLKAMAGGGRANRISRTGDFGPMGPTRMILTKPVIAAIEGYAVAGGAELALWCDLRVFAASATFGIFCRRFGVPLVDLGTVRLPRLIGQSRAMDLILTGRPVGADEAFAVGLANRTAPDGGALDAALDLAGQIAAHPQTCMRNDRRSVLDQWSLDWDAATTREAELGLETLASGETAAGAARFTSGAGRHGAF
jgi:enoyl-CoA hydratase